MFPYILVKMKSYTNKQQQKLLCTNQMVIPKKKKKNLKGKKSGSEYFFPCFLPEGVSDWTGATQGGIEHFALLPGSHLGSDGLAQVSAGYE